MKTETNSFTLTMEKTNSKMEFKTIFDKEQFPDLFFDEPKSSGGDDAYPSASRILTSAVMNCLSASLSFCLAKSRVPMENVQIKTEATTKISRNEEGRLRVQKIMVTITPLFKGNNESDFTNEDFLKKLERCIKIFENYCVVSQSIINGIDISTEIKP